MATLLPFSKLIAQQNGYLVNLKGDTIRCNINPSGGKWKGDDDKHWNKFTADDIKAFHMYEDSSTYASVRLPKAEKLVFLEWLEQGKINLYQAQKESAGYVIKVGFSYSNTVRWYANKDKDDLKQVKVTSTSLIGAGAIGSRKNREKAFTDLIADNPELLSRFKEAVKGAEYSFDLIRYYIKTYNDEYVEKHPGK